MKEIEFIGNKKYPTNDIGVSQLFIDMFSDEVVYCREQGWYIWNGKYWQLDSREGGIINEKMKKMARYCTNKIYENPNIAEEDITKQIKFWSKLSTKAYRDTIIRDSMSINPVNSDVFNKHKFLFNCQNGTYDFKRKIFRDFDKSDYLTDISNVVYDKSADCPRFKQYLDEVMENKQDKVDYLLKIAAYCLTGDTSRECFFVLYGDKTRNGKGTFVSTLNHLMGTYTNTIKSSSITKKTLNTGGSNATPDFAKLKYSRLVNVNEIEDGMMLDIALIKQLTGGDVLTARALYKEEFEFTPQFKIVINTNFLPRMSEDSIFTSDRIHLISFDRHFELSERDLDLKDKLKSETSGIFNLLAFYWDKLKKEGFIVPQTSQDTIQQYRYNSNNVLLFVKEQLYESPTTWETLSDVYKCYATWCEEGGYNQMVKKTFVERLSRCGAFIEDKQARHTNKKGVSVSARGWVKGFSIGPTSMEQYQMKTADLTPIDDKNMPF